MVKSFQITLTAAAKRLSDVYGDGPGVVRAERDLAYRQILFTTEADAFLGETTATTATTYGIKVTATATVPVSIGPFETGPVKLSNLYGAGSGVLHILAIPF